jgi:pyruvate dehydrogenase E2 component (dihydrolipoamide acetyltransferase)
MGALTDIHVPDIGEFADVPVIEILVTVGDHVDLETPLVVIESDKATMELPSPHAGTIREILVAIEDKVSEGTAIARIETDAAPATETDAVPATIETPAHAETPHQPAHEPHHAYAGPSARRHAREAGIDLDAVHGTGHKGRITVEDIQREATSAPGPDADGQPAPASSPTFSKYGPIERVPFTRIQRASAANLTRNWQEIPQVTHHEEADITTLESWRKQVSHEHPDTKVTMVALLIKAITATLEVFPAFNSSLAGDELIVKRYINVGFAADTPAGLVVPVIHHADTKGLLALAAELAELSSKARAGTLTPAEISGGTFTISSLGGIGGTGFTPIVNAPEVAILGVVKARTQPVWDGGQFKPGLILPLSLSYDHRVIDGAAAARFCVHLAATLHDLRNALL